MSMVTRHVTGDASSCTVGHSSRRAVASGEPHGFKVPLMLNGDLRIASRLAVRVFSPFAVTFYFLPSPVFSSNIHCITDHSHRQPDELLRDLAAVIVSL